LIYIVEKLWPVLTYIPSLNRVFLVDEVAYCEIILQITAELAAFAACYDKVSYIFYTEYLCVEMLQCRE